MTLVISRIILRKKDTVAIDGTDAFVSLVDEFASRSIDSLKDAIIDFLPELDIAVRNANGRIHKSILIPSDEQSGEKTVKHQDITNDRQVGKRRTAPKPKGYRETAGAESLAVDIEISSRQER